MLDVRRLRLLYELSLRGTVAATAHALSYTPSAVSQQLAALEREAGVPLLERAGRRVVLTPAALRLVERARRVFDELEIAQAELHAGRETVDGAVRIGAFPSAALALVVPAASALTGRYPEVRVTIREADPDGGIELLRAGEIDILIAYEYDLLTPVPDGGMERVRLVDDPLLVGLPTGHPLAGEAHLELAELVDEHWIAGLPGSTFGSLVQRACRAAGFQPRIAHRAREFALQHAFVAAGLGVALLPRLACAEAGDDVCYVELRPRLVRRISALLRQGSRQRPAVQEMVSALVRARRA